MNKITISQHALDRYRERFRVKRMSDAAIVHRLRGHWENGESLHREGPTIVTEFFTHGKVAEWRHRNGVIMIVAEGVMLTVIHRRKSHKPMFIKRKRHPK